MLFYGFQTHLLPLPTSSNRISNPLIGVEMSDVQCQCPKNKAPVLFANVTNVSLLWWFWIMLLRLMFPPVRLLDKDHDALVTVQALFSTRQNGQVNVSLVVPHVVLVLVTFVAEGAGVSFFFLVPAAALHVQVTSQAFSAGVGSVAHDTSVGWFEIVV